MKRMRKSALCCTVSALTLSMAASSVVMAEGNDNKCGGKNIAVANVSNELLIRQSASGTSNVVGYVPSAAGVLVQSMDEEWTKIKSGDVTGYVKTDYLAFGDKAQELLDVYGVQGAVASWNDVNVFSDFNDTSSVIGTIDEGEGYEVIGSSDLWVEILLDNGRSAYVPAEDVEITQVLDTAVATDEYAQSAASESAAVQQPVYDSSADNVIPETYDSYSGDNGYADDVYTDDIYTDDSYTDNTYGDGTYADDAYTDYDYTDGAYTDDSYTDGSYADGSEADNGYTEETPYTAETEGVDSGEYSNTDYAAETEAPVNYDTTIPADGTDSDYTDDSYDYTDDGVGDDDLTDDGYVESETEDTSSVDNGSDAAINNASDSDLDLLAAIIYCEAGNQSREGKIAVGQVVLNRVASPSFANSIRDVIYESGQFTPAMTGWLDQVIGSAPEDCYEAAIAAMNGEGTVGGALYFNGGSGSGVQIGDHQFY